MSARTPKPSRTAHPIQLIALSALLAFAPSACTSDGPLRFAGQQSVAVAGPQTGVWATGIKILTADAPRTIEPFREVPYTFEVAVVDSLGRFLQNAQVVFSRSTGYIKAFGAADTAWQSAGDAALPTNTLGRVAFRWLPGGEANAQLIVDVNVGYPGTLPGGDRVRRSLDTLVTRIVITGASTVPIRAEQVAPSGVHSTCFLTEGRVGCVGAVATEDADRWTLSPSIAVAEPRWLQFSAKPVQLRSMTEGACALLDTGFTSCWRSLGPPGTVPASSGHPPFVEFSGRLARAADGMIYIMRWNETTTSAPEWVVMPSDSALVTLFTNGGTVACGLARSGTVLCGSDVGPTRNPAPMKVARANPLREVLVADAGAIHSGAFVSDASGAETVLLLRRGGGQSAFYVQWSLFASQSAMASFGVATDTLVAGNGSVRSCARVLSDSCAGLPWTSVARFGSTGGVPTSRDAVDQIYTRVCGIRDVIVCSWRSRSQGRRSFDTLVVRRP